ncbi:tape measure protein [Limosilactobacillus antri]|uniref:tape measure protein n=1 Tax=Limosilactobacillus antri TaxID=227943 RepID=UPI001F5875BD|nr:tape measure protein [Limosilactobacillus antri]
MAQEFSVEAVLSAVDKSFSSTMNQALNNVYKLGQSTNNTAGGVRSAGGSMMGTFKGVAAGMGAVQIASKAWDVVKNSMGGAISRFDTLNKYPVVMHALGYSMGDTAKSSKILQKGIDGLPTSLDEITASAQQLGPLTGSATKAAKSAVALNNAFLASGASSADASRGLQQYTQMMSTGKVDLMSWRTLMETMPTALRAVAKSFGFTGKSAEMDLYNALSKGKISVDQLNDAFIRLNGGSNGFAALAKKNSAGIGTSFANLKNSVIKNLANMLTYIDQGFKNAGFGSIASTLDSMKNGINAAFTAIGPVVAEATTVILNFAKIVSSALNNKIFQGAAIGVLGFIGAFKSINGVIAIVMRLRSAFVALSVIAKAGNLAMAFSEAMSTLAKTSKIAAAAQAAFNAVAAANPYVLIAAAIIAVVAALTFFFAKTKTGQRLWQGFVSFLSSAWETLKSVASTVWNAIAGFISGAVEKAKAVWQGLQNVVSTVWNAITSFISNAVEKIKAVWQPIGEFFSNLWNSIKEVAVGAWNGFISSIQPIIEAFKNLWSALSDFFSVLWQGIVAIATPIWQGFVITISTVVAAVKAVWSGITSFFSSLWQGIVSIAGTIWQGIVTVISVIVNTVKTLWSGITSFFSTLWQGVVTVATTVWQIIVTVVQNAWNNTVALWQTFVTIMATIWQNVVTVAQTVWQVLVTVISAVWNIIVTVVSTAINVVAGIIQAVTAAIQGDWSGAWEAIMGVTSTIWNGIKSIVSTVMNAIKGVISALMNGIKSVFSNGWNAAKNVTSNGINACKDAVANIAKTMISVGKDFVNGFIKGVTSMISAAVDAVMSLGRKAVDTAKSFFKIGSPSRVMMQYGRWFTEGFAIGVTDEIRMVKQAVTAMSKAAMVNPSLSPAGLQDSLSRLNGSVSGNYNGTLTMQDSTLQMQNNQLLRQLVDKSGDVYMDGTPVGHIVAPTVSQDLGQGVSLKGRWS